MLVDTETVSDPKAREALQHSLFWHGRMINQAKLIASWSKDRSTKVGVVIIRPDTRSIIATGYNGLPRGLDDNIEERHDRPLKYEFFEHGERNAFYQAARLGQSVDGCWLYIASLPGGLPPCTDCTRGIIQSGISMLITEPCDYENPRWAEKCKIARSMLSEAHIPHLEIPSQYVVATDSHVA